MKLEGKQPDGTYIPTREDRADVTIEGLLSPNKESLRRHDHIAAVLENNFRRGRGSNRSKKKG